MTESVEMASITISKRFDEAAENGEAIYVTYTEGLSLVDALGMLAFATWATPDTYLSDGEDDE